MRRAVSVTEILNKKFVDVPFSGKWEKAFGIPEMSGVWIIWGHSGNGKTSFAMQLAKVLTNFVTNKVAYVSMEEKARKTMQRAVYIHNMEAVKDKFVILTDSIDELIERLQFRRSPEVLFIDSFQYSGLTKRDYIRLKEMFPNKLFIYISHAEGKHPEGRAAKFVRYDADIKIRVEGYKAMPVSRYGGGEPITIWEEAASKYWGEIE